MLKVTNNYLQQGVISEQAQPSAAGSSSQYQSGATYYEHTPLDSDLMDITFYLGQDAIPDTHNTQFAGSNDAVDVYERYWDNLMHLGGDQSFIDANPEVDDQGLFENGGLLITPNYMRI
ncbi:uncharacterized protein N7459_003674 [Penicillium hispanicum]|uniref:uncharacterized protein n=1 Tax=Penicillium hispanicum TaxID=1080232 RepID=UPI00253FF50D|nr:uncharacterized protein N7459_003674 [Penicillium hispanicum]KAJ5587909.1 hypothetical protein N7459_003674 [Penicillium hispanicum]